MSTVKYLSQWSPGFLHWLKFNTVGMMGTVVQLFALGMLVKLFGKQYYLPATLIAVEIAILHNFIWHVRWTWTERVRKNILGLTSTFVRFNLSSGAVSIVGNLILMRAFVGGMGLNLIVANLASIATCSLISIILS